MQFLLIVSVVMALTTALPQVYHRIRRDTRTEFKICVPMQLLDSCNAMVQAESADGALITCVGARDRSHCLNLIQQRGADFTPVDPEDMWVADNIPDSDFQVFDQIRTKEEPKAPFRYEGVAVIHKALEINSLQQLKGLKSCHTGVGRNVGYKIPITRLRQAGLIGGLNDPVLSPRENELKALSRLFTKACIVGKWAPDADINKQLKKKYSNLCALCEKPTVCDYPDNFSGYDGALRCLSQNGGEIAWTKIYYVKKFFGVPIAQESPVTSKENMDKYAFLCPNGTKVPITFPPACVWAARPWPGFITNQDHVAQIKSLQAKLQELNQVGEEKQPTWFENILTLNNKTFIHTTDELQVPKVYLTKAKYYDVIERDYGPPKKTVRFCVLSNSEMAKCLEFSKMAFARNIRPQFDCIRQERPVECLKLIRDNGADIISLDANAVIRGKTDFNLRAIAAEVNSEVGGVDYAVAVVRKDSNITQWADLQGRRSCHSQYDDPVGYSAPLHTLLKANLISAKHCPYTKSLSEFFSGGSCIPGAEHPEEVPENVCKICAGDVDGKDSASSKCSATKNEAFFGYKGAFRCLATGSGDVAFVRHDTVHKYTDGSSKEKWAISLQSNDFELLCPTGSRMSIDKYAQCNLAKIPPNMVVTNNAKNDNEIDEIKHAILDAAQTFGKRPDLFKLFGGYNGESNLLFRDTASGLIAIDANTPVMIKYEQMIADVKHCDQD